MARFFSRVALVLSAAVMSGMPLSAQDPPPPAAQQAPPTPEPVSPLDVAPPEDPTLARGRYLVQLGNCVSCHTVANGQPFAGGKAFETPRIFGLIGGVIHSSNITPDRDTGIGAWTEDDFITAMRTGVAPGGRNLLPAFPYTSFTKLTTDDLKAIYAFLRTLTPAQATSPKNSFIFQQRWAMAVWNKLFFKSGELANDAAQSEAWNRGRYIVDGLGHCGACHTPRNLMLAERTDAALTGGIQIGEVAPGEDRVWSAPNLTQAQSGLGKWSADDVQKYLRTGHSRRAGTLGPMNEVIANSMRFLTDADGAAIATYIKSLPANGESAQEKLADAEQAAGQALYDKHCDECHLSTGRGGFRKAPPVAGSAIVQAGNAASLVNVILHGAKPAGDMPVSSDAWEDMASFKDKMSDAEVAQLVNFLRTNWGNRGGSVSAGFVAGQR